jgi:hypothetical protein
LHTPPEPSDQQRVYQSGLLALSSQGWIPSSRTSTVRIESGSSEQENRRDNRNNERIFLTKAKEQEKPDRFNLPI